MYRVLRTTGTSREGLALSRVRQALIQSGNYDVRGPSPSSHAELPLGIVMAASVASIRQTVAVYAFSAMTP